MQMNQRLSESTRSSCRRASQHSFLSSSSQVEVSDGGDVSGMVPGHVNDRLIEISRTEV